MTEAPTWEDMFRTRVTQLREARGWTQTDLAGYMSARGFPWHQPTVQRFEKGERAPRLNEAYALAAIFDSTVEEMVDADLTAISRRVGVLTLHLQNDEIFVRTSEHLRSLDEEARDLWHACRGAGSPDEGNSKEVMRLVNSAYGGMLGAHQAVRDARHVLANWWLMGNINGEHREEA